MNVTVGNKIPAKLIHEPVCYNVYSEELEKNIIQTKELIDLDKKYNGLINNCVRRKEISGEIGQEIFIHSADQPLLLLGAGKKAEWNIEAVKYFASFAVQNIKRRGFETLILHIRHFEHDYLIPAIIEGCYAGQYEYEELKSKKDENKTEGIKNIYVLMDKKPANVKALINQGKWIAESQNFARTCVNKPANHLTPKLFAKEIKEFCKDTDLQITILDKKEIEKLNMGAFLCVNQGSKDEPVFIILHHNPEEKIADKKIALIGKGITFDSGGISIKPSLNMHEMKGDMAGGATIAAAMRAICRLNPPLEILGLIPATDNMPSGSAIHPGDVVKAMNGKTIEVVHTDAEGRLILADALCYAVKQKATHIIDIATLTGAVLMTFGDLTTAVLGNDEEFLNQFLTHSRKIGEKVWSLPTYKEYRELLKSPVADIANIGPRGAGAGTILGAKFLEEFVEKAKWIHLDIAGTSDTSKPVYHIPGGTGVMVSSIVNFVVEVLTQTQ